MQLPVQASDAELIEHILTHYHDLHRQQFPELLRLSKRVELVHGGVPECPVGLTALLEKLYKELVVHMNKEEEIVFPMISRGFGAASSWPVTIMRHEHDTQIDLVDEIKRLTHQGVPPLGACTTWRKLYTELEQFIADLDEHIYLEDQVLYARIDAASKKSNPG